MGILLSLWHSEVLWGPGLCPWEQVETPPTHSNMGPESFHPPGANAAVCWCGWLVWDGLGSCLL